MKYLSAQDQFVDVFTKGITKTQFLKLRDNLVSPLSMKRENVGMVMIM